AGSGAAVRGAGVRRLGPEPSRLGRPGPAGQAPQRDGHRRAGVRHPRGALDPDRLDPLRGAPHGAVRPPRRDLRRGRARPGQAHAGHQRRRRHDRPRAGRHHADPGCARADPAHLLRRRVPQLRRRGVDPAVPAVPVERGQRAEPGGGAAGRRPVRAAVRSAAARRRDPARRARGRL
ncbi:MAG: hypothetical protein AVDCRST_MAG54-427, partial [uncultured Actinomycetospora sp.]